MTYAELIAEQAVLTQRLADIRNAMTTTLALGQSSGIGSTNNTQVQLDTLVREELRVKDQLQLLEFKIHGVSINTTRLRSLPRLR